MELTESCRKDPIRLKILGNLPWRFVSTKIIYRLLQEKPLTLLDIGSGWGESLRYLKRFDKSGKMVDTYSVGIDIFVPYLQRARSLYDDLIRADVTTLPIRAGSVDAAIALSIIEHLPKDKGRRLIDSLARIASQTIVFTPSGWLAQHSYHSNEWQRHLSAWHPREFKGLGFRVVGSDGMKFFWKEKQACVCCHQPLKTVFYLFALLSQFVAYYLPQLAFQMVCEKHVVNRKK